MRIIKIMSLLFILTGCQNILRDPVTNQQSFSTPAGQQKTPEVTDSDYQLDAATERTLEIFPLHVGNTWRYDYLGFDDGKEVVWQVVEKVIESKIINGYYVVTLERTADLVDGNPSEGFIALPNEDTFWYLVDGEKIYRFETLLHTDLSNARLELILPFSKAGNGWYPNPYQRSRQEPGMSGFLEVSHPYNTIIPPMGGTYTCYNVAMKFTGATIESTFCETLGYVYKELIYFAHSYGYFSELKGFSVR